MLGSSVQQLHFECGNPCVESIRGTLVFETDDFAGKILLKDDDIWIVFANVPRTYTVGLFWKCLNPLPKKCTKGTLRLKILRNLDDEETFLCLAICSPGAAQALIDEYRDTAYGALERGRMLVGTVVDIQPVSTSQKIFQSLTSFANSSDCAVCLEPLLNKHSLSESREQIILVEVLCGHQFHIECLEQTVSKDCPVCRFPQRPEKASKCAVCHHTFRLRLCLICGYLGCTRDIFAENRDEWMSRGHAGQHFVDTGHLFAFELDTQKVFDYVCNAYVHRLLQDEEGGKLISSEKGNLSLKAVGQFQAEFTHLHVTMNEQLRKQSDHFTSLLSVIDQDHLDKVTASNTIKAVLAAEVETLSHLCKTEQDLCETVEEEMEDLMHQEATLEKELNDLRSKQKVEVNKRQLEESLAEKQIETLLDDYKNLQLNNSSLRSQLADVEYHLQQMQHSNVSSI